MSRMYKVVAVVGSVSAPSRTKTLVEALLTALTEALAGEIAVEIELLELHQLAPHIGIALGRDRLGPVGARAVSSIEGADLIVAASPVYKGTYTGLFKHLIDFVHPDALVGRPVLLAATGGSDRHALAVDHALRPLFAFFRAQTVPAAVYATEADMEAGTIRSEALRQRVREAAGQAARLLAASEPGWLERRRPTLQAA